MQGQVLMRKQGQGTPTQIYRKQGIMQRGNKKIPRQVQTIKLKVLISKVEAST